MFRIMDGKLVSQSVKDRIRNEVSFIKQEGGEVTLAVIIVGDDPASRVYVNNKKKACEYVGFRSLEYALPASTTQEELIALIHELNARDDVNGILCQLPVPKHIDDKAVIAAIDVRKDVDAFSSYNVGKILIGDYDFLPCTPAGVMEILKYYDIDVAGKRCVVIGRSNIVGKPMAALLMHANGTVTVAHKKTRDLRALTSQAEILVSSVGRARFVTGDMVGEGAVVVDVGINRDENGKLCGDVVFDEVAPKCSYITPVPGGVGPMTIAMLMQNTLKAYKLQHASK